MSTGQLHRKTGSLPALRGRSGSSPKLDASQLENLFRTPVPPFHVVFSTPEGFSKDHALYDMHRAANRIYHERIKIYRAKCAQMSVPELVSFIRDDVYSNMLAVEKVGIGPIAVPIYRFLKIKRLWAWFPPHTGQAESMLMSFRRLYRKKKQTIEGPSLTWLPEN